MTTFADLIEESRHHLMTGHSDRINVLDDAIDDTTTTVTLRHINKGVAEGTTLAIDLEEMYVISVTTTGETSNCTVIRGMNGSTKVAHDDGCLIYVNPQFSSFRIGKYVNQCFNNLSSENLFRVKRASFTANLSQRGYDIADITEPEGFLGVWRIRYDTVGPSNDWPVLRPDQFFVDFAANPTDFPSGIGIIFREGIPTGRTVEITYKAGFDPMTALTDDVLTVTGLHTEAHDLPPLYAGICMLAGREVKRSFLHSQPEPRRQEEVPPGSANQSMRPIIERYYDRIDKEVKRLKRRYPGAI